MVSVSEFTRRIFLGKIGGLLSAGAIISPHEFIVEAGAAEKGERNLKEREAEGVAPAEDLMREHGVLSRLLLIYEQILRELKTNKTPFPEVLSSSAGIIRRFVEDYHEKLEEEHLFPRFERAGKLIDLVKVLRAQHEAIRRLTDQIRGRFMASAQEDPWERKELAKSLLLFIRMYRPHKSREDTVLFPVFHSLVSPAEYARLGDEFEDREQALFGQGGFEKIVAEVAKLEKTLGIFDLAQFTPKE
jgi:hemerythrin-like domain-containing protein